MVPRAVEADVTGPGQGSDSERGARVTSVIRRSVHTLVVLVMALAGCRPGGSDGGAGGAASSGGGGEVGDPPEVEYLTGSDPTELGLPFSEAVRVGDMLYLSGQVGNRPGTLELVDGGIVPETRQTMENIRAALERHGSSLDRVVKCTVMIDEIDQWGAFNDVYVEFFPGPKPARSALGADGLALGAAVEVECWATVDPSGAADQD